MTVGVVGISVLGATSVAPARTRSPGGGGSGGGAGGGGAGGDVTTGGGGGAGGVASVAVQLGAVPARGGVATSLVDCARAGVAAKATSATVVRIYLHRPDVAVWIMFFGASEAQLPLETRRAETGFVRRSPWPLLGVMGCRTTRKRLAKRRRSADLASIGCLRPRGNRRHRLPLTPPPPLPLTSGELSDGQPALRPAI